MNPLGQVSIDPVFGWVTLIPLALILVASLWLTLTADGLSRRRRTLLVLLRCGALSILLLGWLRPGLLTETVLETEGAVAVLLDDSQSMTLPSDSLGRDRWQIQQSVWDEIVRLTGLEIGQTKIVPYFYNRQAVAADGQDLPTLTTTFDQAPAGRVTDIGQAIADVTRQQIDPPLRAIILMGDGTQTVIPANTDASLVARQMAQLDQPLFVVGIGNQTERSQLRDVALEGLPEHFSAFVKKDLNVRLVVNAKGMQNQPIKLQLKLRASGENARVIAEREVLAQRPSQLVQQDFEVSVDEPGEYLLEAIALTDTEDQIPSNNSVQSFITVREGGARVLLLDGEPRFEQAFLSRSIDESLDFSLDRAWIEERARKQNPNGVNLVREIEFSDFDAFIIGDLPARGLSNQTQRAIEQSVNNGAGILFMGGYFSFDAGGYGQSLLAPVFPTVLARGGQQNPDQRINTRFHIQGETRLRPRRPHPVTTFANEPENSRIWRNLKPLDGLNRLGSLKSAPGIGILLDDEAGNPALVTGTYGSGRVLAFAGDSTWKWVMSGNRKYHQQFWRQTILWLIGRETLNEGFKLNLERRRLLLDETPTLQIEWFGGGRENKAMPQDVQLTLFRDGTRVSSLGTTSESANALESTISGLVKPGLHRVQLNATGEDGTAYEAEIAFIVRDESVELARPEADLQFLKNVVAANQLAGGRLLLPEDIEQAIDQIENRQEATKVTTVENRRLGDQAWDSWIFLVLFCLLMSVEWSLRKLWQLP